MGIGIILFVIVVFAGVILMSPDTTVQECAEEKCCNGKEGCLNPPETEICTGAASKGPPPSPVKQQKKPRRKPTSAQTKRKPRNKKANTAN